MAYEFRSEKNLAGMSTVLRTKTPWEWLDRSSDFWGDYLSANVPPGLIVKLFKKVTPFARPKPDDEGWFHLEFKYVSDEAREAYERLTQELMDQLMPLLEAEDVEPTTGYH